MYAQTIRNFQSFKLLFQHYIVQLESVFYMGKVGKFNGFFIQRYRSDSAMYSTLPSAKIQPDSLFSIYKSFKLLFQNYIVL